MKVVAHPSQEEVAQATALDLGFPAEINDLCPPGVVYILAAGVDDEPMQVHAITNLEDS